MSLVTDFRAVSESAIEQLAGRFDDLLAPCWRRSGPAISPPSSGRRCARASWTVRDRARQRPSPLHRSPFRPSTPPANTPGWCNKPQPITSAGSRKQAASTSERRRKPRSTSRSLSRWSSTSRARRSDRARPSWTGAACRWRTGQSPAGCRRSTRPGADDRRRGGRVDPGIRRPSSGQGPGSAGPLPERIAELSGDVPVETLRDTMNAYTELVGMIYGSLADRGEQTWSRVRSSSLRPGTIIDAMQMRGGGPNPPRGNRWPPR